MSDEYVIDLSTGEILRFDPYKVRGAGMPAGYKWLHDLTPEEVTNVLPEFMRRTDERLRSLETEFHNIGSEAW